MTALLQLRDVEARYGAVKVLHGIALEVGTGELVAVLGANGAGKTTTLRAVSGTVRRTGDVIFDGHKLPRRPDAAARAGIAHVPEGRGTFSELSVWENLRLGAYTRRGSVKDEARRVFDYFPRLEERKGQQAGTLSGGEQQMCSIGRALMSRPKLLLLDEPSMGLAPILVDKIFEIIQEINREGTTILLVEQNALIALGIASRGYVLETGKVTLSDRAEALATNDEVRKAYLGIS